MCADLVLHTHKVVTTTQALAINFREPGMSFEGGLGASGPLLTDWDPLLEAFPADPPQASRHSKYSGWTVGIVQDSQG